MPQNVPVTSSGPLQRGVARCAHQVQGEGNKRADGQECAHLHTHYTHARAKLYAHVLFAQAKVCQHNVSILVQQNILRLEVAVQHVVLVQESKSRRDLGGIKQGALLRKFLLFVEVKVPVQRANTS